MPDNDAITKPNPGRGNTTSVSWKEYVDSRLTAIEKATSLASETLSVRLETMNRIREQLDAQVRTLLPKAEYELFKMQIMDDIDNICKQLNSLQESRAELKGKADQGALNNTTTMAAISLLLGVMGILISIFLK